MSRRLPSTTFEHPGFWRDRIVREESIRTQWNATFGKQILEQRIRNQQRENSAENRPVIPQSREARLSQDASPRNDQSQESPRLLTPCIQMVTPRQSQLHESQNGRSVYETQGYAQPIGERDAENEQVKYDSQEVPRRPFVLSMGQSSEKPRLLPPTRQVPSRKDYKQESHQPRYAKPGREWAAENQQIKAESRKAPSWPPALSTMGQTHEIKIVSAPEYYNGPKYSQVAADKLTGFEYSRPGSSKQQAGPYSGHGKVIEQTTENRNVLHYRKPIPFTNLTSLEDQVPFQEQIRPGVDPNGWGAHFHLQHITTCKKCYNYPCECANFKCSVNIPIRSNGPAEDLPSWDRDNPQKNPKIRDMGEYGTHRLRQRLSQQPPGLTSLGRHWFYGIRAGNTGEHHSGWNPRLCLHCEGREEAQHHLGNDLVEENVEYPKFFYMPQEYRKEF